METKKGKLPRKELRKRLRIRNHLVFRSLPAALEGKDAGSMVWPDSASWLVKGEEKQVKRFIVRRLRLRGITNTYLLLESLRIQVMRVIRSTAHPAITKPNLDVTCYFKAAVPRKKCHFPQCICEIIADGHACFLQICDVRFKVKYLCTFFHFDLFTRTAAG